MITCTSSGYKGFPQHCSHPTWVWGFHMVWTWRIKLWDRNATSLTPNALATSSTWQLSEDRKSEISLLSRYRAAPMKGTLKVPSALLGWRGHPGKLCAVCLCRIWNGENQRISPWKCPWHGNCFHVLRKMKSRKVLLFLCKCGSKRRVSLGRREAVVHLESLKLAFEAREHIAIFFPHSINNSWQAETTLIAWDEVEQPAGSTAE